LTGFWSAPALSLIGKNSKLARVNLFHQEAIKERGFNPLCYVLRQHPFHQP
jgi:hypothetical protein